MGLKKRYEEKYVLFRFTLRGVRFLVLRDFPGHEGAEACDATLKGEVIGLVGP